MGFYEDFAFCYDRIFPVDPETVQFLTATLGPAPARVLDLACGTGGYAVDLARAGLVMTGIDLSPEMITIAQAKVEPGLPACFKVGDMARLEPAGLFEGVYCIGNSLVHLAGPGMIREALDSWRRQLAPGGRWVIQILNYDRVLANQVTALPPIDSADGARLIRNYKIVSDQQIIFKTHLICDGRSYHNEVPLYPLIRRDLLQLLDNAGLQADGEFGDFDRTPWAKDSFAYVVTGNAG